MIKVKFITLCVILLIFSGKINSQGLQFHGRASNSVYSYEDTSSHTRLYQLVKFSLQSPGFNNMSLNGSFRALSDLDATLDDDQRFKSYYLNLEFKKLFNRLDVVLGRQFLHPGTVLGGLDGLYTKFRFTNNISLAAYGGVEAHFNRSFKIYEFEDSFTAGGLFDWKNLYSTNLQLLYLQKANENETYWQIAGLNFTNKIIPKTMLQFQGHYDLQNSRFHRLLVSARHKLNKKIAFNLAFKNQYPQVYANSFYTIFEIEAYRQYRLGTSYQINNKCFVNAQYQLVQFGGEENANRVFLTLNRLNGSLGFVYETGYAGEQLGVVFDYAYNITPKLMASLNIDYSRYKTEEVYEFDNQIANAVRLSYELLSNLRIDAEYQWLTNRFKEQDSRFLNHIHFSW